MKTHHMNSVFLLHFMSPTLSAERHSHGYRVRLISWKSWHQLCFIKVCEIQGENIVLQQSSSRLSAPVYIDFKLEASCWVHTSNNKDRLPAIFNVSQWNEHTNRRPTLITVWRAVMLQHTNEELKCHSVICFCITIYTTRLMLLLLVMGENNFLLSASFVPISC